MPHSNQTISVLGVCSGRGQSREGVELGPIVLRQQGLLDSLRSVIREAEGSNEGVISIIDRGDLHPEPGSDRQGWQILAKVREVAHACLKTGDRLLTLGGDHSLAIATVGASLDLFDDLRVVWVDAHGDMNTPKASLTGQLHGMPLAALLGLFSTEPRLRALAPKNLLMIGVRELDDFEKELIADLEIEVISASEMNSIDGTGRRRMRAWLDRNPDQPVHLSFDIDAIDPSAAPATGLHVEAGLSFETVERLVRDLSLSSPVVAVDVVEFNPLSATSERELQSTVDCVKMILKNCFASPHPKGKCYDNVIGS